MKISYYQWAEKKRNFLGDQTTGISPPMNKRPHFTQLRNKT